MQDSGETPREDEDARLHRHCEERKRFARNDRGCFRLESERLTGVVLAKARTHNHRLSFSEGRLPPSAAERFRGVGPGVRQDNGGLFDN